MTTSHYPHDIAGQRDNVITSQEALTRVFLDARHGIPPMDFSELRAFSAANFVNPDQVRAAEKQGRDLAASGTRCMCPLCQANSAALGCRERLRQDYCTRRHAELVVHGMHYADRVRLIDAEIEAGAALQAAPVVVTRTKGVE